MLLLVHGFPLDRRMWIEQLEGLAGVRRAVAVDLRGHGLSQDPTPDKRYSMDLYADDLAATLDEVGAEKADLCGLSMGGYVLFAFWRRHRGRVRSLIFCCTKAEADTAEAKDGREKTAALVREKGMEALFDTLLERMFAKAPPEHVVEKCRQMFLGTPPEVGAADSLAMRDRPDSTPELSGIDVPVLWIAGEDDLIMPLEQARAAASAIPGARFVQVPGAGHMAPLENPEAVNASILDFLKGVS